VCASDDDAVQIIDRATLQIVGELPSRADPETFALGEGNLRAWRGGNRLFVSNENDEMVTVIDVPTRTVVAKIPTGVEPEGMAVSPDGTTVVNTSETTNMAHFIDYATRKVVAAVLVDPRPRIAQFKHDGAEVWVSSELGGYGQRHRPCQTHREKQDPLRGSRPSAGCHPAGRYSFH